MPSQLPFSRAVWTHSSPLAWKIPWTEEPDGLRSTGPQRVGHNWETSLSRFTFMPWRRKWQPTAGVWPGESQGWGSLVGCRLWVAQRQTRLTWFSSSNRAVWPILQLLWKLGVCGLTRLQRIVSIHWGPSCPDLLGLASPMSNQNEAPSFHLHYRAFCGISLRINFSWVCWMLIFA